MNAEFMEALEALYKEKGIEKEIILETIEVALSSAYKKNYNASSNVKVDIDRDTGVVKVYAIKSVVEVAEDPYLQISLDDAKQIKSFYDIGDLLEIEVTPKTFGRIAAQTAKQVVVQRIREAERGVIYNEYIEKENEILTALVQRVDGKVVFVELGRTEGMIEAQGQMPNEVLSQGDRIKVYVLEVSKESRGSQVLVSRSHPGLVKRLLELEVPEIQNGAVLIKGIAREAGFRTKVAVYSNDSNIDSVGACVGMRGTRIDNIVNELNGEKIDIIEWSSDPAKYISNALSPANVLRTWLNESSKAAVVMVSDKQLSLAIGKEGQNARLAAKLTGWKIDIKSQNQIEDVGIDEY